MTQVSTREFVAALVLKAVLDRTSHGEPETARISAVAPVRRRDGDAPARPGRAVPALMLLALGVVVMVLFESALTRVIGVAALFGFVVAGAFAIADPRWLGSAPAQGGRERQEHV